MSSNPGHGLVKTLAGGLKDVPRNASWLVGRAFAPHDDTEGRSNGTSSGGSGNGGGATGVMGTLAHAGRALKDALPGDSVESRLVTARAASDRAKGAEHDALEAAQNARDLAGRAEDQEAQEKAHLLEVQAEQGDLVEQRVADARRRADDAVAAEHDAATSDAHQVIERERQAGEGRVGEAREEADRARADAEERYRRATELLAEARNLADEAADAATAAAEEARAEAERISADARRDADEAEAGVQRVQELRADAAATATAVAHTVKDRDLPGRMTDLNKPELLDLAIAQGVPHAKSKTKSQLVDAINKRS